MLSTINLLHVTIEVKPFQGFLTGPGFPLFSVNSHLQPWISTLRAERRTMHLLNCSTLNLVSSNKYLSYIEDGRCYFSLLSYNSLPSSRIVIFIGQNDHPIHHMCV